MRFAVLFVTLIAVLSGVEGDPRPTMLVIGENNSHPFGASPSWINLVADEHPEWNIIADIDPARTLETTTAGLDAIFAPIARVDLVLVFVGINDIDGKRWPADGAAGLQARTRALLERLKQLPKASKARVVVSTLMPVVDRRSDKWTKERFPEGESRSTAMAEAWRTTAAATGADVIDVHAWALADSDDNGPGRLVGSNGWMMRDWGHPIFATYMKAELEKRMPAPPDAEAFAQWKEHQQLLAQADAILARTGSGTVRHGPALAATTEKALMTVDIPSAALTGPDLNLLIRAEAGKGAVIVAGNEKPKPTLIIATAEGDVRIESPATAWQVIDEATPDVAVDPNRFRLNAGKMRYYPMVREEPGVRRWLLLRFPLAALGKRTAAGARVALGFNGNLDNADAPLGGFQVHLVLGRDRLWHESRATWSSRDGRVGWAGEAKDTATREREVTTLFGAGHPSVAQILGE